MVGPIVLNVRVTEGRNDVIIDGLLVQPDPVALHLLQKRRPIPAMSTSSLKV